jgi:hypothetical protein
MTTAERSRCRRRSPRRLFADLANAPRTTHRRRSNTQPSDTGIHSAVAATAADAAAAALYRSMSRRRLSRPRRR